jgi:hypothetical protein
MSAVYPDTVLYVKITLERIGLQTAMVLAAINIWTGAPLLAVWVGSRTVTTSRPTMGAVFLIVVVLAVACVALIWALNAASAAYDDITGRKQAVRRHVPWLRSMRAERVNYEREKEVVTPLERGLVMMVALVVVLFEIWFFFFSPSPIGAN